MCGISVVFAGLETAELIVMFKMSPPGVICVHLVLAPVSCNQTLIKHCWGSGAQIHYFIEWGLFFLSQTETRPQVTLKIIMSVSDSKFSVEVFVRIVLLHCWDPPQFVNSGRRRRKKKKSAVCIVTEHLAKSDDVSGWRMTTLRFHLWRNNSTFSSPYRLNIHRSCILMMAAFHRQICRCYTKCQRCSGHPETLPHISLLNAPNNHFSCSSLTAAF